MNFTLLQNEKDHLEETANWQRQQEIRLKDEEQQTLKTKQQLQQVRNAREFSALQRQMFLILDWFVVIRSADISLCRDATFRRLV